MKRNCEVPCSAGSKWAALVSGHTPLPPPRHSSFDSCVCCLCFVFKDTSGSRANADLSASTSPMLGLQAHATTPDLRLGFLIPGQTPGLTC